MKIRKISIGWGATKRTETIKNFKAGKLREIKPYSQMQIFECRKNLLLGPFPKQSYTYKEIRDQLIRPYVKAAYTRLTLCATSDKRNEGICHVRSSQCDCEKTRN